MDPQFNFFDSDNFDEQVDSSQSQKARKGKMNDSFAIYSIPEKKIPARFFEDEQQQQNYQIIQEGQPFGRYMIQGELGRGGMGVVYKATDTQLKRTVALKVILKGNQNDIKRFIRESSAMAQLEHNNIVKLHEFGVTPQPFFTMEYIEGFTLADLIKEKKIKPLFLLDLMIKVCDALAHAHKHKILHRDIKPSNIMITNQGEPKVMDFGLAKISGASEKNLSKTGDVLGTILYMAPEQINGKATERSDIYSIGATMYESLTYRNVFQGDSYHNIFFQILQNDPIPLRQLNPNISPYIEAVCLKCIAKKQEKRYQSFKQLTRELKNLKSHKPIIAKTYSTIDVFKSFIGKHKIIFSLVTFFVVALSIVSFSLFIAWEQANKNRNLATQATLEMEKEKNKTSNALKKVMKAVNYSVRKYQVLQKDEVFASFFSEIIEDLEKYEKNQDWSFIKGFIAGQSGDSQSSIKYYSLQIKNNPNNDLAYNNRGSLYKNLKQYEKALADYNKAIAIDPDNFVAYKNRGILYQDLKQYEKALADYNKAIDIDPNNFEAYNNRGLLYKHLKQYEKALADYNKTIVIDPNNSFAYNNRGALYKDLKQYEKALADHNKAIALEPNNFKAYNNRGALYKDLKQYEKALADYNKTIAIDPNNSKAYNNRGALYKYLKQHEKALADYNKTIAIDPNNGFAYNNRGALYLYLKKYQKAIVDFNKTISISSNMWQPHHGLYLCYKALNQNKKAAYHKQQAEKLKK
ncbi:tetratricopeptide repeat protein [Candidatus Uabimicrobium amorphum]|uniref:non-specific serine/threonine protein kinase n=1 Tax=Uabimicrobium amorphum TaxID=2596890 RepID=A0A5S9IP27_UABAM|nr:serine/threonine-protein kinase [Candidatus Uabimicrobium amorphum]BBM84851.1 hypothetical protein UABAM_03212 [Candidatus Uabimicrobium amorphum]